ncbi:Replication protein A 70 kDa DNA-binding subunit A [Rhynchospora pubera]|uniref:Replication protein A 70 kDa DNA-binding subunit A n=1 Tax=Rhynchospora pubera TaxID=906938 RepID=A0AAV8H8J5_9POAL|nr:Replication protein A 70 kDa DNA-binding subunit A [Rhynchospora pubera]
MDHLTPVATLTHMTNTDNAVVHGRPVRIWPTADVRFGRVWNMAFLFIDHTGGPIQDIVPVTDYQRLSNIFSEDNICQITRFTVENSQKDYQVVDHKYMLSLTRQTLITMLQPDAYPIPRNYFQFRPLSDVGVAVTHLKAVMDVIARVVGFGDTIHRNVGGQPSRVRGMYLKDSGGRTIEVALWGDYTEYFNIVDLFERSKQGPIIIICNSLQIKYWRGIYGLKTYSGTRFFLDPSMKEISDYLAVTPYDGNPFTLHATSETFNIHVATSPALLRADPIKVTMAELSSMYLDNYNENYYQCAGIIMNINNRCDWYYDSCPECRRKLGRQGPDLWCGHCNTRKTNTMPWYKLRVQAVDHTMSAQFVLLGRFGEQVVGMTAQQLLAVQHEAKNKTPEALTAIIGKKYLFTVAGKQRIPYQENRIYTVVNLEEVPSDMLALLPEPILHIETASLASGTTMLPWKNTPAEASIETPAYPETPARHSHSQGELEDNPAKSDGAPEDMKGKRPLAQEEGAPGFPSKSVKRKLDFDHNVSDDVQSRTPATTAPSGE